MKLNKLERHTAYIIMLHEAEKELGVNPDLPVGICIQGFCRMALELFGIENLNELEELAKHRPGYLTNDDGYWFSCYGSGWLKRIEILKQCIQETY
jgi:hypothetical protein